MNVCNPSNELKFKNLKFSENFIQVPCDVSLYMNLCKKVNNKKCRVSSLALIYTICRPKGITRAYAFHFH